MLNFTQNKKIAVPFIDFDVVSKKFQIKIPISVNLTKLNVYLK